MVISDRREIKMKKCWIAVFAMLAALIISGCSTETDVSEAGSTVPATTQSEDLSLNSQFAQILPINDGSVAVLYKDGTVRVSGNDHFEEAVSYWENVTRLYYDNYSMFYQEPMLVGRTEEGRVLTTEGITIEWRDVDELHFDYRGIMGVTRDGRILTYGNWELAESIKWLTDVECLVPGGPYGDYYGCLKKDGTVGFVDEQSDSFEVVWENVKELHATMHSNYIIRNDGTVESDLEGDCPELTNAAKIISLNDWLIGLSADGQLLSYNGDNLFTNFGAWMVAEPGCEEYAGEVDIRQYNGIKDIQVWDGLILLNKDGTVDTITFEPTWVLDDWNHIDSIYTGWEPETYVMSIYGIKEDGSVIVARHIPDEMDQNVIDQYKNWKLQDIYPGDGGVIGLTTEGKLVGDGIYENIDFSLFD